MVFLDDMMRKGGKGKGGKRGKEVLDKWRVDPEDGLWKTKPEFIEKYGSFVEWDFAKASMQAAFPPAPRADVEDEDQKLEREWQERYGFMEKKSIEEKNREAFGKSFKIKCPGGHGQYGATDGGLDKVMKHVGRLQESWDPHVVSADNMSLQCEVGTEERTWGRDTLAIEQGESGEYQVKKEIRDKSEQPKSAQKWLDQIMDNAHGKDASSNLGKRKRHEDQVRRELIEMSAAFAGSTKEEAQKESGSSSATEQQKMLRIEARKEELREAKKGPVTARLAAMRQKATFKGKFDEGQPVVYIGGGRFKAGQFCVLTVGDKGVVETINGDSANPYNVRFPAYGIVISLQEGDLRRVAGQKAPSKPAAPPPPMDPMSGPGGMSDDSDS